MITEINSSDLLDQHGKFTVKPVLYKNHYLPSPSNLITSLGINASTLSFIQAVERECDSTLDLSDSTKRNLGTVGVGSNSAQKIVDWTKSILNPDLLTQITLLAHNSSEFSFNKSSSISLEWLAFLEGISRSPQRKKLNINDQTLFNFINKRCRNENSLYENIINKIRDSSLEVKNLKEIWQLMKVLWANDTLVPKEKLNLISTFFDDSDITDESLAEDNQELFHASIYLEYDFYLEAIAHFEVGVLMYFKRIIEIPNIQECGFVLLPAIKAYSLSAEDTEYSSIGSCFGGLLSVLKEMLSRSDEVNNESKNSGWRKLATFIDIETDSSCESLPQRQYETIKHWRKGKDTPSPKAQRSFIAQFLNHLGKKGNDLYGCIVRISLLIDKLERELLENSENRVLTEIHIKKVLSRYPIYYKKCLEENLKKSAP